MDKFLFPLNYKYSAKFLGIIEYKTLLPIASVAVFVAFILYMLKLDFFISVGLIVFITLPPILLLSTGIKGQPAIPYFKAVISFSRHNKIYIYGHSSNKHS